MFDLFGDLLVACGKTFPLTSSRFKNLISDCLTPMEKTFDTFGDPPYTLEAGVKQTIQWLEEHEKLTTDSGANE